MVSHSQVIHNYFNASDKEHYNKGSSIYFVNDTLYSYGTHFILAQRIKNGYILNGDKNSISTAKHQSYTRQEAPNKSPIIPFSALAQILKYAPALNTPELRKIEIIDVTEDTYEDYTYKDKEGNTQTGQRHFLGASLIKYHNKYYLSSIDNGSKNHQFFLVELPKHNTDITRCFNCKTDVGVHKDKLHDWQCNVCKSENIRYTELMSKPLTVNKAFRLLAGNLSDSEYNKYLESSIKRQGEYFLIPEYENLHKILRINKIKKGYDLSKGKGNKHIARDMFKTPTGIYIRGTLRHVEHKMVSLKEVWHKVIKNTAIRSFTASGNVD